jgi:hypothetical protein
LVTQETLMSDSTMTDVRAPVGIRLLTRWHQRPVIRYEGSVRALRRVLPRFQRRPTFRYDMHEIIGASPRSAKREIVVGNVSSQYVLVQHDQFLDALNSAMAVEGYDFDAMPGVLTTTSSGERMELTVYLTAFSATPADGYPLECRLRCLNSVDGTTALEADTQWYRKICSNGMFGWQGGSLRHIHRYGNVLGWLQKHLGHRFRELPKDRLLFSELLKKAVSIDALKDWVDVFVARRWGRADAARTYQICLGGKDGCVYDYDKTRRPHELEFTSKTDVPGACAPAQNLYHIGQALSWVAGQAVTLERRFSQTSAIPSLLRRLMN